MPDPINGPTIKKQIVLGKQLDVAKQLDTTRQLKVLGDDDLKNSEKKILNANKSLRLYAFFWRADKNKEKEREQKELKQKQEVQVETNGNFEFYEGTALHFVKDAKIWKLKGKKGSRLVDVLARIYDPHVYSDDKVTFNQFERKKIMRLVKSLNPGIRNLDKYKLETVFNIPSISKVRVALGVSEFDDLINVAQSLAADEFRKKFYKVVKSVNKEDVNAFATKIANKLAMRIEIPRKVLLKKIDLILPPRIRLKVNLYLEMTWNIMGKGLNNAVIRSVKSGKANYTDLFIEKVIGEFTYSMKMTKEALELGAKLGDTKYGIGLDLSGKKPLLNFSFEKDVKVIKTDEGKISVSNKTKFIFEFESSLTDEAKEMLTNFSKNLEPRSDAVYVYEGPTQKEVSAGLLRGVALGILAGLLTFATAGSAPALAGATTAVAALIVSAGKPSLETEQFNSPTLE